MKKFILTAVAAGALAVGGAASAQDLGGILGSLFGFGTQTYPTYNSGIPAVVAGTQPHGATVYTDQYGRQFYYDQYGRQVVVQQQNTYNNPVIVGYDSWGRPVYGQRQYGTTQYGTPQYGTSQYGTYAYGTNSWDRDGDGIANTRDRWPDDRRYW